MKEHLKALFIPMSLLIVLFSIVIYLFSNIDSKTTNCINYKMQFLQYEKSVSDSLLISQEEFKSRKEVLRILFNEVQEQCKSEDYKIETIIYSKYHPNILILKGIK